MTIIISLIQKTENNNFFIVKLKEYKIFIFLSVTLLLNLWYLRNLTSNSREGSITFLQIDILTYGPPIEGRGEGSKYLTYRLLANREHLQIVTRDTNIGWPNSKIFCNIYSERTCLHVRRTRPFVPIIFTIALFVRNFACEQIDVFDLAK